MIGERYWSTGLTIKQRGDKWVVVLDFFDDGFCQDDSTEGTLVVRYQVEDLDRAVDVLVADAGRFGIVWMTASGGPSVYCEQDGELDDGDHPELWEIANAQAARLGWGPIYTRTEVVRPNRRRRYYRNGLTT